MVGKRHGYDDMDLPVPFILESISRNEIPYKLEHGKSMLTRHTGPRTAFRWASRKKLRKFVNFQHTHSYRNSIPQRRRYPGSRYEECFYYSSFETLH